MIITRRLAGRLKTVFRQALALSTRSVMPAIELVGGPSGLRIRCRSDQAAAEFWLDGGQREETVSMPFEMLSDIEGRREAPVEIQERDGRVTAAWREGSIPQLVQQDRPLVRCADWPPFPKRLLENPPRLSRALAENLPRLPGNRLLNDPVTLDLNGSVTVRAHQPGQPAATELILSRSTREGEPLRINTNRRYLARAAKLGFERLHIFTPRAPVLACDENRRYVWALLDPDSAVPPSPNVVRVESTAPAA
jgi:hypothetical protein